jgi:hypothetical protein
VRLRAYELYLQRGAAPGNELDDWLQAEAEITGKKKLSASAGERKSQHKVVAA